MGSLAHGTLTHHKWSDSTDAGPGEWQRASMASNEKECLGCFGCVAVTVLGEASGDLSESHHGVAIQIPHLYLAMSNCHLRHRHLSQSQNLHGLHGYRCSPIL